MRVDAFQVVPALPERLQGLRDLALNLLWSWDDEIRVVFHRVDRELWNRTRQNPVLLLGLVSQARLDELAKDDGFLAFFDRVYARYQGYLKEKAWWEKRYPEKPLVAYFSAEFGLTECLPIYSGGLGVLAGHHLKSGSDLGVPIVGVGLLYQQGYFRQYLTADGWQQESYPTNDFYNLPVVPVVGPDGRPLRIELPLAGERLLVQVWKAEVGRVPLYLLDTNLEENRPELQDITDQLYGGDQENRVRQEIVLGMGGLRALHSMGLAPVVCHMNEGHSAFLALERTRVLMKESGCGFHEALEAARAGSVFTTHTPVPAGFDAFPQAIMEKYFGNYAREAGISMGELLALGRPPGADPSATFNMAGLALHTSAFVNGVSRLHGEVSRRLLRIYAPNVPDAEVPIAYVTNGAHTWSCVSQEMAGLFDRYLGPDWCRKPGQATTWQDIDSIPDEELWSTHERRRERLVSFARKRLMRQSEHRGATARDLERARGLLDTRTLTIGFARRFATYKRADLILADLERLKRILLDPERPVQILFAGKAHPKDSDGKEKLKAVVSFCQRDEVRRHAVFLEDYDLEMARYLVQGVDVWLNTPRRGMEASGTSGMKVVPNGGLNLSVLDGWWCEGYAPEVGWAIGKGEEYSDHVYQDQVESGALYELLEKDVVPLFYSRQADGLPRAWIARMKASMKRLAPAFSTNRMIWEYAERFYLPAARHFAGLSANGMERARQLAAWKRSVQASWGQVRVEAVRAVRAEPLRVGEGLDVEAEVSLGALRPEDVAVEVYFGPLDPQRQIQEGRAEAMRLLGPAESGRFRYTGRLPCDRSGLLGYGVRIRPSHPDANNLLATGLMSWW